jgi:hypothetical protein
MIENKETMSYADQRIAELIKEGVNVEQEFQIETLSKQLVLYLSEINSLNAQKDLIMAETKRF